MTISSEYANRFVPLKFFLSSYRALSDGRSGIGSLERRLDEAKSFLSEWKIMWIGTCTTLRTAIDLFRVDAQSCLSSKIRIEIEAEWADIRTRKEDHAIFWQFLRLERDNVIREYEWRAYEAWLKPDGSTVPPISRS